MTKVKQPPRPPSLFTFLQCALLTLSLTSACQLNCTGDPHEECEEGLYIEFEEDLGPGTYLLEVELPDGSLSCEIDFPDGNTSCSDPSTPVEVRLNDWGIYIPDTPETISVSITGQESGETAKRSYTAGYRNHGPNGTECPPFCPRDGTTMPAVSP